MHSHSLYSETELPRLPELRDVTHEVLPTKTHHQTTGFSGCLPSIWSLKNIQPIRQEADTDVIGSLNHKVQKYNIWTFKYQVFALVFSMKKIV